MSSIEGMMNVLFGIRRRAGLWAAAAGLAVWVGGTGCSTTSVFSAHTSRMAPVIGELKTMQPVPVERLFVSEVASNDKVLYRMERGRVAQLAGNQAQSIADFDALFREFEEQDRRALVSASGGGAQVAAVAVNDNAIPYEGEGYERTMAMTFQCVNFLLDGRVEATQSGGGGAKPVALRLIQEQQVQEQRYQKEIGKAREEASGANRENAARMQAELGRQYAGMDAVAGKVKSSFENAYAFTVAGLVLEMADDPENAKVMYRKALEIAPECRYLQREVKRLADGAPAVTGDQGELVLFYEPDFVAAKQEIKFPVPLIIQGKIISSAVAFPYYRVDGTVPAPLLVTEGGVEVGSTETICSMNVLAVKALKEHVPALVTRQVVRAVAKGAMAYGAAELTEQGVRHNSRGNRRNNANDEAAAELAGLFMGLAVSVWNYVSENADQRSWLTLPASVQYLRVPLPAGEHALSLQPSPGAGTGGAPLSVTVRRGGKTLVWVSRTGPFLRLRSVAYPLPPPAAAPAPAAVPPPPPPEGAAAAPAAAAPAVPVAP